MSIAALDLTNTFWNVQWAYTLALARLKCPAVAPMLAARRGMDVVYLHVARLSGH